MTYYRPYLDLMNLVNNQHYYRSEFAFENLIKSVEQFISNNPDADPYWLMTPFVFRGASAKGVPFNPFVSFADLETALMSASDSLNHLLVKYPQFLPISNEVEQAINALSPQSPHRLHLASWLIRLGNSAELALQISEKALALDPTSGCAYYFKAKSSFELGDITTIEEDLAKAERLGASKAWTNLLLTRYQNRIRGFEMNEYPPVPPYRSKPADVRGVTDNAKNLLSSSSASRSDLRQMLNELTEEVMYGESKTARTLMNRIVVRLRNFPSSPDSIWNKMPGFVNDDEEAILRRYFRLSKEKPIIWDREDLLFYRDDLHQIGKFHQRYSNYAFEVVPRIWLEKLVKPEFFGILNVRSEVDVSSYWDYDDTESTNPEVILFLNGLNDEAKEDPDEPYELTEDFEYFFSDDGPSNI